MGVFVGTVFAFFGWLEAGLNKFLSELAMLSYGYLFSGEQVAKICHWSLPGRCGPYEW